MSNDQELIRKLNSRIDMNRNKVLNVLLGTFGTSYFDLFFKSIDNFNLLYMVKDSLKIGYFSDCDDVYVIGQEDILSGVYSNLFSNRLKDFILSDRLNVTYRDIDNNCYSYYKLDIFGKRCDKNYIFGVISLFLNNIGYRSIIDRMNCFLNDTDSYVNYERYYNYILNEVSRDISLCLHNNNIFIFDDVFGYDKDYYDEVRLIDKDFYVGLSDMLPMFLTDPDRFLSIVGKDNFKEFVRNCEDGIDNSEVIERMKCCRDEFNSCRIDISLISDTIKRIRSKEK